MNERTSQPTNQPENVYYTLRQLTPWSYRCPDAVAICWGMLSSGFFFPRVTQQFPVFFSISFFLTADSIRLWNILWTFLLRVTRPCCVFMKWTEATHELHARKVRDSAKTPTLLAIFFRSKDTLLSWNVKGLFSGCFTKISKLKQFQAWTLKKCPVEELLALNSLNVDIFCLPLSVQIPAWFYQSSTIEVLAHAMPIAILFVYN